MACFFRSIVWVVHRISKKHRNWSMNSNFVMHLSHRCTVRYFECYGICFSFWWLCSFSVALLSGARNDKNTHLSEQIYGRMRELFPDLSDQLTSAAVLLANVYGSSGDIHKASDIRIELARSGAKKQIGLSWTVVNEQVYVHSVECVCLYLHGFFCVVVFSCSWSISSSIVGDLCRTGSNIKGIDQSWLSIRFKLGDKTITQRWKHWLRPLRTQRTACHCLEFRRKCQPSSNSGR